MKRIAFITPKDARLGFALTGVDQITTDKAGVTQSLEKILEGRDVGLIILDERLYFHLSQDYLTHIERHWEGILLPLPAPAKIEEIPEDYVMQLIARAIGYHVRLEA